MRRTWTAAAVAIALVAAPRLVPACPAAVTAAIEKAYPGAKISGCRSEKEDGKVLTEARVRTQDGRSLELELNADGAIVQTEENVPVASVPEAVMHALDAKYADAKPHAAEKQTDADGKISYEIEFRVGSSRKEATFTEDGTFVEEE